MRLSGLVVAAILLVSATLLAQHPSGAGGSSSGGSSSVSSSGASFHSSYSSSSSSHVNSAGSSVSSRSSGSASSSSGRTGQATVGSSVRTHAPESGAKPEKKSVFSFLRHKKPTPKSSLQAEAEPPLRCKKGRNCTPCAAGENRNGVGACVSMAQAHRCPNGEFWNGFACGLPYRFNDCSTLASQLAAQERHMLGQSDAGQDLFYQLLKQQYEACLGRFGFYAYRSATSPFDTLKVPRDKP